MTSVAFLGSHGLGVDVLERLVASPDASVEVVVTYPRDYDSWWDASVHDFAWNEDLPTLTIEEERDLLDYDVDYLLSVYYPNVLGRELLDHPSEGALNLHQAELPRYRGSNVFSHSIMNARRDDHWRHGTTLHFMAEEVDAGDVVDRAFVEITEEDTARTLYAKVEAASVELFEATLPAIVSGRVHEMRTPQEAFEGERYFYGKDSLEGEKEIPLDRLADPEASLAVYDKVRALDFPPFEPAFTTLDGRRVYLTKTSYESLCDR